jgi:hypothetical protein
MIKRIVFLCAFGALVSLSSCKDEDKPVNGALPIMSFTEQSFDFGNIHQGDRVSHVFHFTNNGAADLIISNAVGSCGCTVPEYTQEPIHAGESGEINVSFNSAGKSGRQTKTVTITTNTAKGREVISIAASITAG